jgi:4-hydroxybutyryl-CoA dehydratase/vinylacetyl-CoA-Delta-isomerase
MGLRTANDYVAGLRDDRAVYYRGEKVADVTKHPELGIAVKHASTDFAVAHNPAHRALAVARDGESEFSAYFKLPRTAEDLTLRSRLIELSTAEGGTLVVLIKEIGSDALFALRRVLGRSHAAEGMERLENFHELCRASDLALAVAQTDVKGDRSLPPSRQPDPDMYLRVVREDSRGIIVRGAKAHTSCSPYVDWLLVLPSRSLRAEDEEWALAFATPVATPGLTLYASDFLHGADGGFSAPVSSRHRMIETLTVFDDVFIPWERVFVYRRPELAGALALTFVEYHRFTAVSYKLPLLDALVGVAILAAEANGISAAHHVREKLTWLIGYAEEVRGLTDLAAIRCEYEAGLAYPHVLTTNLAKWVFARDFHKALHIVQDLAGGLIVTGPSAADWESSEIRPVLEKYLKGAWPADRRLAVLNLVSDLTAGPYGGYQAALAVHAEGSLEAEKLTIHRAYDATRATALASRLAGLAQGDRTPQSEPGPT